MSTHMTNTEGEDQPWSAADLVQHKLGAPSQTQTTIYLLTRKESGAKIMSQGKNNKKQNKIKILLMINWLYYNL